MWGLQLSILNDPKFYHDFDSNGKPGKETSLKKKHELIDQAKAADPRLIELVCLKNRYGISNYKVPFEYRPRSDLFWEPFKDNDKDTWITEL